MVGTETLGRSFGRWDERELRAAASCGLLTGRAHAGWSYFLRARAAAQCVGRAGVCECIVHRERTGMKG